MITNVKITLNDADPFDAVMIAYLSGRKNRAGAIKKIMYDHIIMQGSGQVHRSLHASPVPVIAEAVREFVSAKSESDKDLDKKISKFGM